MSKFEFRAYCIISKTKHHIMRKTRLSTEGIIASLALLLTAACSPAPQTYGPLPTEDQLKWADMEYYMFCHFGPNTFSGLQWGLGDEDPDIFNPSELDCEQWVRTAKEAGMKGIILTAKHHDGFCLWPSAYSDHTVAQSSWLDGKGDVVKELRKACDKYDFPMGVYISPWDRNHPSYGTDEYNQVFANTIAEVHQNYGPFFEQWFDGANGGAHVPAYDWPLFHKAVYDNSPHAVIFSDVGPGCRWIGNESGWAGETNWCRLDVEGFEPGKNAPATKILNEGQPDGAEWIPGEVDVPIRADWFYNTTNESTLKSVDDLMDIWFSSVGRGCNLILNVTPDQRGLLPQADSIRLMEFKAARDAYFAKKLANCRNKGGNVTLKVKEPCKCIVLQEDIKYGQKIKAFTVEALVAGEWQKVVEGTTIGHKRILPFDASVDASKIRVTVTDSFAEPMLKSVTIY